MELFNLSLLQQLKIKYWNSALLNDSTIEPVKSGLHYSTIPLWNHWRYSTIELLKYTTIGLHNGWSIELWKQSINQLSPSHTIQLITCPPLLIIPLANYLTIRLLHCSTTQLGNHWTCQPLNYSTIQLFDDWTIEILNILKMCNYSPTQLLTNTTKELSNYRSIHLSNYSTIYLFNNSNSSTTHLSNYFIIQWMKLLKYSTIQPKNCATTQLFDKSALQLSNYLIVQLFIYWTVKIHQPHNCSTI